MSPVARPTKPPFSWAEPWLTVGITGTNGKTSTTHLVAAILRASGRPALRLGTVGAAIDDVPVPTPATLREVYGVFERAHAQGVRHAAVELTSKALAEGYAKLWRFDVGVFTNLSADHRATHGSWEHYLASKAQLLVHLGPGRTAVLNAGDEAALLLHQAIPADVERRWFWAPSRGPQLHDAADLRAEHVAVDLSGTDVELGPSAWADALGGRIRVQMTGEVFAENALAAAAAGFAAGVDAKAVKAGLAACPPVPGRFEVIARDPAVVVDHAHSPDALARTCDTARGLARGRVIVVFGAGGEASADKRAPMGEAVGARADLAILTSDNPRHEDPASIAAAIEVGARRAGRAEITIELDRGRAIERALQEAKAGDVVVIAGRGHETTQQIGDEVHRFSDAEVVREILGEGR